MCHASGHNSRNSSFIVDVAMGQIPRSTERISSIDNAIVHERVCVCVCVSVVILKQHIAD